MATITISDESYADAQGLVREGRFETIDQAVEEGLLQLLAELDEEQEDAAIRRGLADAAAGRAISGDVMFERLRRRYRQPDAA